MRRRVALVVNPTSGSGRAARLVATVAARLGADADVEVHQGAGPAESRTVLDGLAGTCDAVVVLGGDGLVQLAAQALALGDTPLGIVPAGSGNDVAATLGLPADPLAAADAVLAALHAGSTRRIDLGRVDGDGADRWWVTVLCAGFDSAVTERANGLRWPHGPRRYDVAIALEFLRLRSLEFRLELDGTTLEQPALLVAVGNGPQYGGGKRIAHGADLGDGEFLVTVVAPVSRRHLARLAPTLPHAGHLAHPAVTQHRARRVRVAVPRVAGAGPITPDAGPIAYADGERIGALPISTQCVPAALPVLVPPGSYPPGS